MTSKSRDQVDKEIHIRRMGGKVASVDKGSKGKSTGKVTTPRSAAQVEKDAHRNKTSGRPMPRGRLSDAATGRLRGMGSSPGMQPRDLKGRWT